MILRTVDHLPQALRLQKKYLEFVQSNWPENGIEMYWGEAKEPRSYDQLKLLWGGAYQPIAVHMSDVSGKAITTEMVHCVAKDRFLKPIIVEFNGKSKGYPGSTTNLSKREMSEFIEKVFAWGSEMGVVFGEDLTL